MRELVVANLAFLSLASLTANENLQPLYTPCVNYTNFSSFNNLIQSSLHRKWSTPRRSIFTEKRLRLQKNISNKQHHHQHNGANPRTKETTDFDYRSVMLTSPGVGERKVICNKSTTLGEPQHQPQEADLVQNFFEKNEWKKNFASIECGAKLVRSSDNVKHPYHLITRNADEYLLYSCQDSTYFVIELCETIKVIRFELDNYELYSGTVGRFSVRMADKFSNNLEDWVSIGTFEAGSGKMEVQHFTNLPVKIFGKFIRVDLESFHGSEHYCTMTSFRVFGMTEYEYLTLNDGIIDVMDEAVVKKEKEYSSKMIEVDMFNQDTEQTTYFSYKYLFLQIRDDVCVDTMDLRKIEKSTFRPDTKNIPNANKQKDSVLITLSNKVKTLEKNVTLHQTNLQDLDKLFSQTSIDLKQILKSITKADAWIKDSGAETEKTKGRMGDLSERIHLLESELSRLEDTFLLGLGILVVILIGFIFTTSVVVIFCTKSSAKVEDSKIPLQPIGTKSTKTSVSVQTDPPQIMKKVTFPDSKQGEENHVSGVGLNEDISTKLFTTRRKNDLSRRVTWCSGTFRKITRDPRKNVEI